MVDIFVQVVSYHSTEKSRKHKEIIVEVEQPINKDSDTYDVTFDVPAVPPTGMIHCNIIDVLYTLKVRLSRIFTTDKNRNPTDIATSPYSIILISILIAIFFVAGESNRIRELSQKFFLPYLCSSTFLQINHSRFTLNIIF